jgi:hypothetical protein
MDYINKKCESKAHMPETTHFPLVNRNVHEEIKIRSIEIGATIPRAGNGE